MGTEVGECAGGCSPRFWPSAARQRVHTNRIGERRDCWHDFGRFDRWLDWPQADLRLAVRGFIHITDLSLSGERLLRSKAVGVCVRGRRIDRSILRLVSVVFARAIS